MYTEQELNELEQFFKSATLPHQIELIPSQKIIDVSKFIDSHLAAARNNIGKNTFSAFYDRLVMLKTLIQK